MIKTHLNPVMVKTVLKQCHFVDRALNKNPEGLKFQGLTWPRNKKGRGLTCTLGPIQKVHNNKSTKISPEIFKSRVKFGSFSGKEDHRKSKLPLTGQIIVPTCLLGPT